METTGLFCPYCGEENLLGADVCVGCQQSLTRLEGIIPTTKVRETLMKNKLADIEGKPPISVSEEATVIEAVRTMRRERVGCLLITKAGQLTGIVTERDILMQVLGKKKDVTKTKVKTVMTPNPETLTDDVPVAAAFNMMSLGEYRHLPVIKNGKPIGVLSIRDLLRYVAKNFPESIP